MAWFIGRERVWKENINNSKDSKVGDEDIFIDKARDRGRNWKGAVDDDRKRSDTK